MFAVRESQRSPPISSVVPDPALLRFLDVIWMERGLAANTLAAYRADLLALQQWLETRGSTLAAASRTHLLDYVAARVSAGARPRSTARQLSAFDSTFPRGPRSDSSPECPSAWER